MATRTTTTAWTNNSDANFRAWGSWLSGCFSAFGWTATYSAFATGTNWTDVTTPAAAHTARVTEVWAMADAGQATAPLYLKIEYGETATADCPGFRIQLGTGHAGSGVLSGIIYDSGATYLGATATNTNSMTHYASGDAGRCIIAMSASGTAWSQNNTLVISIDRRRDGSGVAATTGFLFSFAYGATVVAKGFLSGSASAFAGNSWYFPAANTNASDATLDSKVGVYPQIFNVGPSEIGIAVVGVIRSSYPVGTSFTCTVLGSSRTYMPLQLTSGSASFSGATLLTPAILYE